MKKKLVKGRVLIPYQFRKQLDIDYYNNLYFSLEAKQVIVKKCDEETDFCCESFTISEVDKNGYVSIPKYIRKELTLNDDNMVNLYLHGRSLILQKA